MLMGLRNWFAARRTAFAFWRRQLRIRLAILLTKPVDGMVASRVVYLQGTKLLAEFMGTVDRSGILKGQPAKYAQLEREVQRLTQAFVDAMRLGDPTLQLPEVQQVYVQARIRSLPKKQRQELEYRQALAQLGARGEAVGKQRRQRITVPPVVAAEQAPTPVPAGAPA